MSQVLIVEIKCNVERTANRRTELYLILLVLIPITIFFRKWLISKADVNELEISSTQLTEVLKRNMFMLGGSACLIISISHKRLGPRIWYIYIIIVFSSKSEKGDTALWVKVKVERGESNWRAGSFIPSLLSRISGSSLSHSWKWSLVLP
jgi:hypothetical protein